MLIGWICLCASGVQDRCMQCPEIMCICWILIVVFVGLVVGVCCCFFPFPSPHCVDMHIGEHVHILPFFLFRYLFRVRGGRCVVKVACLIIRICMLVYKFRSNLFFVLFRLFFSCKRKTVSFYALFCIMQVTVRDCRLPARTWMDRCFLP